MGKTPRERLRESAETAFRESIQAKEHLVQNGMDLILDMAETVAQAFRAGHKLFLFGNGGSAADAQHLAAEFVNRFEMERRPLPALALTVDTSILTSVGNDFQFGDIFIRQLQALAHSGDVALGISTSGTSPNVVKALKWARENRIQTLGFTGAKSCEMDTYCDIVLHVSSNVTARIQECHITAGHILCSLVEQMLFGKMDGGA